jgi:hypothetical protein
MDTSYTKGSFEHCLDLSNNTKHQYLITEQEVMGNISLLVESEIYSWGGR